MSTDRLRIVTRLADLIILAQQSRAMPSLRELARRHACSPRTIRRDLEAIELVLPVRWRVKDDAA